MGLDQTKKSLRSKGNHHKMKTQPTEGENIFANNTFDKGLISKIYQELIHLNTKKQTIQLQNGQRT